MAGAQESEDHRPSNGRVVIERGDRRAELGFLETRRVYRPLLHLDDSRIADSLSAGQPWQSVGVKSALLHAHREIALAMLARAITEARAAGVRRLRAEVDSDDPWTLYTCAELPFARDKQSVSLALMPKWRGDG